jgi:SAM-dependent methyltransferase
MSRSHTAKTRKKARRRGRSLAACADRHALYEQAVQDPVADVELLARLFRKYRRRQPLTMREDFCGTGVLSLAWARSHPKRVAVGVDLDEATLAWGVDNRIAKASPEVARRVRLVQGDVLDGGGPPVDIVCAMNFSYCVFKTRGELRRYFEVARGQLVEDGLFVLDLFGGNEAIIEDEVDTQCDGFVYRWEQASFNPLSHDIVCHIHFLFPDGSAMRRAFTYDWRLWTIPELRELLHEAGFSRVHVLWERTDEDGDETGAYYEPARVENQECWWTYIAAER